MFAALLAFAVLLLGAYTRLTHAGLGCPDWPGCYGHMLVPDSAQIQPGQFSGTPLQEKKAWTEMAHRYAAGTLGLLVLCLTVQVVRRHRHAMPVALFLLVLIVFQAALGMWTVTLKLLPVVVMAHLLGGMLIFATLCYLCLSLSGRKVPVLMFTKRDFKPWALLGLCIVFVQIALGGWVSANYAGIACVGFPFCNGSLLPHLDLQSAFNFLSPIGANYQGGVLDSASRVTIQVVHRLGAFMVVAYLGFLTVWLMVSERGKSLRSIALMIAVLLAIQVGLGIINVTNLLPLSVAVMHNGVAALLLASLVTLNYKLRGAV